MGSFGKLLSHELESRTEGLKAVGMTVHTTPRFLSPLRAKNLQKVGGKSGGFVTVTGRFKLVVCQSVRGDAISGLHDPTTTGLATKDFAR